MAFKMELYKGGELHYRAARQRRYFVGAFVLCVVLFVVGCINNAQFFDQAGALFILLWLLCLSLAFHGQFANLTQNNFLPVSSLGIG